MKRLIEFVKGASVKEVVIAAVLLFVAFLAVRSLVGSIGSSMNDARVNKLETEKQQILKQRDEARARDLILQGEIKAKDQVIESLTSQIAESNQRVTIAHKETQSARVNYEKVRSDPPKFNASDDAGRVVEFSTGLRELYSDPPR